MKNLVCALAVTLLSASSIFASSDVKNEKVSKELDVKKTEVIVVKEEKVKDAFFTVYTGKCKAGYRFNFTARNRSETQGFVNGYCATRREMQ